MEHGKDRITRQQGVDVSHGRPRRNNRWMALYREYPTRTKRQPLAMGADIDPSFSISVPGSRDTPPAEPIPNPVPGVGVTESGTDFSNPFLNSIPCSTPLRVVRIEIQCPWLFQKHGT